MKTAIVALVLLTTGFLSFLLTRPRCESNANEVYNALESGHLSQAFERLASCETTLCVGRARLARVYLLQVDGKLEEASKELISAKAWVERAGGPMITQETALASALQHLLEGDGEFAAAELRGEESLLRGIAAFYCEDWALAASLLENPPDPQRRWIRTVTNHYFPPAWCLEAKAASLIEMGNYLQARELIGTPHHPLFGKSLLKEADRLPIEQALPLYQQVSDICRHLGIQKEIITSALLRSQEKEVLTLLSHCLDGEGQLKLARQLIEIYPSSFKNGDFGIPAFKRAAAEKVSHLLSTRSFKEAISYIPFCQELSPLEEIEEHVIQASKQDLGQFHASLALWEATHPTQVGKLHLSLLLLNACEGNWRDEGVISIIDQASHLPDAQGRETFLKELGCTLNNAYAQALVDNEPAALLVILRCSKTHNLNILPMISTAEIANQLADIRHLLHLGRTKEAQKIALWLIGVHPLSQETQAFLHQLLNSNNEESLIS